MSFKKIVSGALAAAMVLSLSTTAFADTPTPVKPVTETTESSFQVELEGTIYTPTIRVQVTESGSVYVNPTGSVVAGTMAKALDGTGNLDYSFDGLTVVSTPILVRSDTDKALDVTATATATVPKTSGISLAASKPTTATDKQVYLYVTGNSDALGDSSALKTTTTTGDDGSTTTTVGLTDANITTSGTSGMGKLVPVENTSGKSAKSTETKVATIGAATQTKDATGKVTAAIPQYGVVVVAGDVASKATGWTESDIVNVSVALTFAINND